MHVLQQNCGLVHYVHLPQLLVKLVRPIPCSSSMYTTYRRMTIPYTTLHKYPSSLCSYRCHKGLIINRQYLTALVQFVEQFDRVFWGIIRQLNIPHLILDTVLNLLEHVFLVGILHLKVLNKDILL